MKQLNSKLLRNSLKESAIGAKYESQGQVRSEAERVAPGRKKPRASRPEGPKYTYSALSGLRDIFLILTQGRRPDKVGTCPWLLYSAPLALCVLLIGSGFFVESKPVPAAPAGAAVLKDAFKNDFMIGAALNRRQIFEEDTRGAAIVRTHFNSITPENVLKWALVHPEPGRYDFAAPDRFVDFGEKHGMFVVGHTLVWHNQTPRWVFQDEKGNPVDRETLLNRLREHIFTVVGRYKGRIKGWDVVNEALNQDGTMRQSPWFKIIGEDYLAKAFQFAHEADPSAELYYNDYDLELPAKRTGGVALIQKLKAAGVPISGLGLQNHNLMDWPSVADEDATITAFKKLGMKIHITELDVDVLPRTTKPGADYAVDVTVTPQLNPYADRLPDAQQQALAKRYAELFQVYLKHRDAIERVTFWGVADADSWLNNWPMKGRTNYPLLFDRLGGAKPALTAVIKLKE
jgi:endo-1,4-beta-xylanase